MCTQKVLLVDDDPNVLRGYQRSLRKQFEIETALCSEEALTAVNFLGPFAVIVSDMNMPRENGVQLLQRFMSDSPDSVRIMLTGNADQQTASDAINKSHVFRFLNKPCKSAELGEAIASGIEQHRLITAERELLTKTVHGSIHMLTEILSAVNPFAFGRADRLRRLMGELAQLAKVEKPWECEIAAMLSQIGCVNVPIQVLEKAQQGDALAEDEIETMAGRYQFACDLIGQIPRLENAAQIVAQQDEQLIAGLSATEITLSAHLLRIARDYDRLLQKGLGESLALAQLSQAVDVYHPDAIEALRQLVEKQPEYESREVPAAALSVGWLLASDVKTTDGMLLVKAGQEITNSLLLRLTNHSQDAKIEEPLTVLVPIETATAEVSTADLATA